VNQSVRELVGTRHYDVCHTMQFNERGTLAQLLVLAELATEQDRTRAVYPATLFSAMETLFDGVVTSSTKHRAKAAPLPSDIAKETKAAVIDAYPSRQQRMEEEIRLRTGSPWPARTSLRDHCKISLHLRLSTPDIPLFASSSVLD
jgi:hypothetical protein